MNPKMPQHPSPRHPGGPAQHAGNRYHYLYASNRVLELLDPDSDVIGVYLEGTGTNVSDEDAVDVCVERRDATELIQVRWAGDPQNRPLQLAEW